MVMPVGINQVSRNFLRCTYILFIVCLVLVLIDYIMTIHTFLGNPQDLPAVSLPSKRDVVRTFWPSTGKN